MSAHDSPVSGYSKVMMPAHHVVPLPDLPSVSREDLVKSQKANPFLSDLWDDAFPVEKIKCYSWLLCPRGFAGE